MVETSRSRSDLAWWSVGLALIGGVGYVVALLLESPLSLVGPIISLVAVVLGFRALEGSSRRAAIAGISLGILGILVALPTIIFYFTSEVLGQT